MRVAPLACVLAFGLGLGTASGEQPTPTTVARPKTMAVKLPGWQPRPAGFIPHEPSSRILYLHRCPEQGCLVFPGTDDSRTNTSSLVVGNATIGAFTRGDATWAAVVQCVKDTYAPFDLMVTDVDPGPNVPHYEAIVGGRDTDLGMGDLGAGGIAPSICFDHANAISFTFDVWGNDALQICAVVAQESGHAFGLEHEMNPKDPMTYLSGALPKRFQAADVQCGEYEPRACSCVSGGKQNSYEYLLALFGAGVATPPMISIKSPATGKRVQPGFAMRVKAEDDVAIERVELAIDGEILAETMTEPFTLVAPDTIAEGPHVLTAIAYDVQGTPAESTPVDIVMGPPCTAGSGCDGNDVCVMGVCIPGPGAAGGIGGFCQADTECLSMQCLKDSTGEAQCVAPCDLATPGTCPEDFTCIASADGDSGVCWYNGSGGCCDAGGRGGPGAMLLALGVLAVVFRRRRQ